MPFCFPRKQKMQQKRKKNKKNAISLKLRDFRKTLGLNQTEFANEVGIGTRTLASWESGEIEPSTRKISMILKKCSLENPNAVIKHFPDFDNFVSSNYLIKEKNPKQITELIKEVEMLKDDLIKQMKKTERLHDEKIDLMNEISDLKDEIISLKQQPLGRKKVG
tara:strand:+ start:443 stop:934 length:492 start_codon:yes stop_codon:yes gene_type:complete